EVVRGAEPREQGRVTRRLGALLGVLERQLLLGVAALAAAAARAAHVADEAIVVPAHAEPRVAELRQLRVGAVVEDHVRLVKGQLACVARAQGLHRAPVERGERALVEGRATGRVRALLPAAARPGLVQQVVAEDAVVARKAASDMLPGRRVAVAYPDAARA